MKRTLAQAAAACGGRLQGADVAFGTVSSDSRAVAPGDLFVALKGEKFDAHDFLADVARSGAAGAIVSREGAGVPLPQVIVPDTLQALTALAGQWRAQFNMPVVGVAGSNGKTTVKEMTAAILSKMGPCMSTRGNLNNHIGVPLTLMRLESTYLSAVVEIGANHPGEVAALAKVARPTIGLITNAGAEHLEGFGDLDGVARAEGEMVASLPAEGTAVINADDPYASLWHEMATANSRSTFGLEATADFHATQIAQSIDQGEFKLRFVLHMRTTNQSSPVELRLAGRHNVRNALAAAAAAHAAGASLKNIVDGLQSVSAVRGRLQLKPASGGAWIIDDSYNANLDSVAVALQVLGDLPGPKWMLLADMAELGEHGERSHIEAGELARKHGVDRLFAAGPLSAHAAKSFGPNAQWFPDVLSALAPLKAGLRAGTTVLIKGSRFNRLERVVEALMGDTNKMGEVH